MDPELQKKLFNRVYPEITNIKFINGHDKLGEKAPPSINNWFQLSYKFNDTDVRFSGRTKQVMPSSAFNFPDEFHACLDINGKLYDEGQEAIEKFKEFELTTEGNPLYELFETHGSIGDMCKIDFNS